MSNDFSTFAKAIGALREALDARKDSIARDASIQRFEFCVELSWKSSKKYLGTSTSGPKQVVREMAQNGLIVDAILWLQAIDERNLSSHTYNEQIAERVYSFAQAFFPNFESLHAKLAEE